MVEKRKGRQQQAPLPGSPMRFGTKRNTFSFASFALRVASWESRTSPWLVFAAALGSDCDFFAILGVSALAGMSRCQEGVLYDGDDGVMVMVMTRRRRWWWWKMEAGKASCLVIDCVDEIGSGSHAEQRTAATATMMTTHSTPHSDDTWPRAPPPGRGKKTRY